MSGTEPGSRLLKVAIAVEDALQRAVVEAFGRFGRRRVAVLTFLGHGSPDRVHIRARVVLGRVGLPEQDGEQTGRIAGGRRTAEAATDRRAAAGADGRAPRAATAGAAETGTTGGAAGTGAGDQLAGTGTTGGAAGTGAGDQSAGTGARGEAAQAGAAGGSADSGAGGRQADAGAAAVAEVVRRSPWRTLATSLGRFLTVELPGAVVTVHGLGAPCRLVADREGYVDAVLECGGLPLGWQDLRLTAEWRGQRAEAVARVLVVDPAARFAVVSDVDDTVLETGLTRGLAFLRITLLTEVADREPLAGAAPLYRALTAGPDGSSAAVFYLSTSPWNLHDLLLQFIALREFPAGPLLLTDWGPGRGALFRVPAEQHKLTLIRQVLADHPDLRLVLVGDTGQVDPEIYAAVAAETPDRLLAIYVRRTPGIGPERDAQVRRIAAAVSAAGVPMLAVDDSVQIAEHAEQIGLLDRSAVERVRTASRA